MMSLLAQSSPPGFTFEVPIDALTIVGTLGAAGGVVLVAVIGVAFGFRIAKKAYAWMGASLEGHAPGSGEHGHHGAFIGPLGRDPWDGDDERNYAFADYDRSDPARIRRPRRLENRKHRSREV